MKRFYDSISWYSMGGDGTGPAAALLYVHSILPFPALQHRSCGASPGLLQQRSPGILHLCAPTLRQQEKAQSRKQGRGGVMEWKWEWGSAQRRGSAGVKGTSRVELVHCCLHTACIAACTLWWGDARRAESSELCTRPLFFPFVCTFFPLCI